MFAINVDTYIQYISAKTHFWQRGFSQSQLTQNHRHQNNSSLSQEKPWIYSILDIFQNIFNSLIGPRQGMQGLKVKTKINVHWKTRLQGFYSSVLFRLKLCICRSERKLGKIIKDHKLLQTDCIQPLTKRCKQSLKLRRVWFKVFHRRQEAAPWGECEDWLPPSVRTMQLSVSEVEPVIMTIISFVF